MATATKPKPKEAKKRNWAGIGAMAALAVIALALVVAVGRYFFSDIQWTSGESSAPAATPAPVVTTRQAAPVASDAETARVPRVPPADRANIESVVHTVPDVPFEPGRSEWRQLPEGYEALPTPDLVSSPTVLNMYCSETRNGPERLWTPADRCIGGGFRLSVPNNRGAMQVPVTYQLSWVAN